MQVPCRLYLCSMNKPVRVRFAPSPTGGLHLGGVRTVLYNYLFARKHGGTFVLRTEDTDQTRFVEGAEDYIFRCLEWCGLVPDESAFHGGPFAPYRQSERKDLYRNYAMDLVKRGLAYYAFDTPEELEQMREQRKQAGHSSLQYDHSIRMTMNNSLRLLPEETQELISKGTPYVIRIKVNPNETVVFTDMIRGELKFDTNSVDDKVLLKADGMPTYHLAVVVDDYLMKISHAFRGEEWLPSAPVHILLWNYLFGLDDMPEWAHLPLILKPDGNGKLSKRDGDRLGFPVYAMNWTDPRSNEFTRGFREMGFLPEAFVNLLALLGWNDGTEQEVFTLDELVERFSIDRVHKGGAKFDFEKAKWFNQEWIRRKPAEALNDDVREQFREAGKPLQVTDAVLTDVIALVKDRCVLLSDFVQQAGFFFFTPEKVDLDALKPKWDVAKSTFFEQWIQQLQSDTEWTAATLETQFKAHAASAGLKPGDLMLPLRVMLVGGKFGPGVFEIAARIGREETCNRVQHVVSLLR